MSQIVGDKGRISAIEPNPETFIVLCANLALNGIRNTKPLNTFVAAVFRSGEMQIERFRPILYFENEIREKSVELLTFVMNTFGYHLYFHPAPLFEPSNFFGNPVNHWAPTEYVSMMILGVPSERNLTFGLKRITDPNEWWDFGLPVSGYFTASAE